MKNSAIACFSLFFGMIGAAVGEPISASQIAVVDGDTIDAHGHRYRLVGYDTPEITTRRRKVGPEEQAVAAIAKERFTELLGSGTLDLSEVPCSCPANKLRNGTCNHGRKCAVLSVNGRNVGDTLIAEELAVPYTCSATRCPRMPDWPRIIRQQMR